MAHMNIDQMHEMLSRSYGLHRMGILNWWPNDLCTLILIRLKNGLMTMEFRRLSSSNGQQQQNLGVLNIKKKCCELELKQFYYCNGAQKNGHVKRKKNSPKSVWCKNHKVHVINENRKSLNWTKKLTRPNRYIHILPATVNGRKVFAYIIIWDAQWTMDGWMFFFLLSLLALSSFRKTAGDLHFL